LRDEGFYEGEGVIIGDILKERNCGRARFERRKFFFKHGD
jgi:hypothetical protein